MVSKKTPAKSTVQPKPATKVATKAAPAAKKAPAKKTARPRAAKAAVAAAPVVAPAAAAARGRSQAAEPFADPAAQLDKLDADPPAAARSRSRSATAVARPVVAGLPADFFASYTGERLNDQAMADAAAALGCETAAVKAVAEVESRGAGFDALGRPTVLYERQVFSRNCTPKGRFDSMPDISAPTGYGRGNYGNTESQWQKIAKAYALDPVAALKAPSWGIFQVLGENHKACGFANVADFVRLMVTSQVGHLQVFVAFIRANPSLLKAIREKDWATFARWYNGKDFATFKYDQKMAAAYARHAAAG
ncbi:MAG: N-acetylmuramidase family protein [Rubrivivax sp.]|nr:N-acetylmuramidase family protein [Rubrivivax sp.]